ncbi:MAG: acylphosphatase [Chloroflexota bacterium]
MHVSGRVQGVQGVHFRVATREQARAHGVCGWVRNLDDGRVEAVFKGDRSAVQHVVSWCYRGPSFAHVDHVDLQWEQPTGQEKPFFVVW